MKNLFYGFLFAFLLIGGIWFATYFYGKNNKSETVYKTTKIESKDIFKKTMATGKILPRKEVKMKSSVSGIIEKLYIGTGSVVEKGDLLAKIKIIPNAQSTTQAKSAIKRAELNLSNASLELDRNKNLFDKGIIAKVEFDKYTYNYDLKVQELQEAKESLQVIKTGASNNAKNTLTNIRATISGTVLNIGALVGDHITEANTFTEGTTIATVADMRSVYFSGKVDESEVGKLKEGLPIILKVGAIEDVEFDAVLDFIAPKGEEEDKTVKFSINASITIPDTIQLRAGYSANAEIVLDKRENVYTLSEGNIIFKNDSTFVEIEKEEQHFEKKHIKTGLSDGIFVEIISGIDTSDVVKIQNSGE